jgi:diguanylate cyclase (GGDEF)-like protein/hemerythrin-like metal-binding protein/PAS domain S-box-containing protein
MQKIDIFPWDDNFNTGIELIDTQHRQLVLILNRLATNIAYESSRDKLGTIFDELIDYTLYHFQTEEAIWHKYLPDNPLEIEHQAVHQEFVDTVVHFKAEQYTRSFDEIAEETLGFLARWLASHILESDRYMAHIVLALQEGLSLNDAKAHARERMSELTLVLIDVVLSRYRALSSNTLHLMREMKDRQQKEEKLQLAASVFTHAREGIFITDANNKIIEVNNTFTLITGYKREEVLGKNPRFLRSGKQDPEFYAEMWKSLAEKDYWSGEIWNRRKNGEEYAEMLTISAILDDTGKIRNYVALFSDITMVKEHQSQLEHIAHYDVLTDLPNRVLLADRLSQALLNSQRNNVAVAVAFIDIDGFKEINDTHGHNMGDDLLVALSMRMQHALREGDTLARVGGDEFLVILVGLKNPEDCNPVLERLLLAASEPVMIDGLSIRVSASIGLSISVPDGSIDGDQLIRQADQAMYQAKQSGKNRYHVFDLEKDSAINIQRESIEHIKAALDNHEFILYYQPKVNMTTGEVIGVEALIRWQRPEHGLVPPIAFLPIIEDHTISIELGEWVIDTALSQIEAWKVVGLEIPISVNISALQLQQTNFVSRVEELLAAHANVEPYFLELEVLETSAIGDIAQVSTVMNRCLNLGVRFALDDFGTGYSSLTYLRRLPANLIKIDQIFVRDMLIDPDDLAIVEGVVGLAKAFGREVIAEGVETIEHGKALLQIGCELAQGFGIARAMRASDIPEWIVSWKPDTMWSEFIPDQNDFNINSEVDHQHWISALQEYLNGKKDTPPPMDSDKCHFGHWLKEEGAKQYDQHPEFPVLVNIHERLHTLGRELVDLYKRGDHNEAQSREVELLTIYSKQIKKIGEILS